MYFPKKLILTNHVLSYGLYWNDVEIKTIPIDFLYDKISIYLFSFLLEYTRND